MPMPAVGVRGSLPGPPGCQAPDHAFAILLGRAPMSLEARCLAQAPAQQGAQLGASVGYAFV